MSRRRSSERPEKVEEKKFTNKVRLLGAEILKQGGVGPYGMGGFNDRLVLCPYETPIFIEFKRIIDGVIEEPTKRQKSRHRKLRRLGYKTFVVATAARAFKICRRIMRNKQVPKSIWRHWRP